VISTGAMQFGDAHWGATPEAQDAASALIEEGSSVAAAEARAGGKKRLAATIEEYAPVVTAYIKQLTDPARRVDILEARLKNARARGASSATIRLIEARLKAARRNAGEQARQRSETTTIQQSAVTATRVWTAVGVIGIIFLATRIVKGR
jgi:hypothetical protein